MIDAQAIPRNLRHANVRDFKAGTEVERAACSLDHASERLQIARKHSMDSVLHARGAPCDAADLHLRPCTVLNCSTAITYLGTAIRAWPILVIQVDLQYSVSILITGRFVLPTVSNRYLVSQPQKPCII